MVLEIEKRKKSKIIIPIIIVAVLIIGVASWIGLQYFTKTGLFKVWGTISYDDSLTETEIAQLKEIFIEDIKLEQNLNIKAEYLLKKPELAANQILTEIDVPTVEYNENTISISSEEVMERLNTDLDTLYIANFTSINDLDQSKRVIPIGDDYYFDSYSKGAIFRILTFESTTYEEEIKPLVAHLELTEYPNQDNVLSFNQTGVTALSRNMNSKLKEVGNDATFFSQSIANFLSSADLTHISNESSFSDYASGSNICSNPLFIDTILDIGTDIVELTGNHNRDCGNDTAINTINIYHENNIQTVGGGTDLEDAKTPLQISQKGNNITFLAYNESTGGSAVGTLAGANQYDEENLIAEIANAKERGDFIIVDIQYYECWCYPEEGYEKPECDYADWSSTYNQKTFFRHIIDLGADLVVGTSAHQPQTYELYGNGAIYYGLGNLFFDQTWWPGTTRSLILTHYFYQGKLIQTRLTGTVYGSDYQTTLMDAETNKNFLDRLVSAQPTD